MSESRLVTVLEKLFCYLKYQKDFFMKMNIVMPEMDSAYQDFINEMNEYLFSEKNKNQEILSDDNSMLQSPQDTFDESQNTEEVSMDTNYEKDGASTRVYSCLSCNEVFASAGDLLHHTNESHEQNTRKGDFECGLCGYVYENVKDLTKHEMEHFRKGVGRKFNDFDGKILFSKQPVCTSETEDRIDHDFAFVKDMESYLPKCKPADFLELKNRINQYCCRFCPRSFGSTNALIRHLQMHGEKRPFKCKFCPIRFKTVTIAKNHIETTHCKIKRFKCVKCPLSFNKKSTLDDHMFTHTGVSKYVCDICQKGFRRPSHLTNHIKEAHKDTNYSCSICLLDFQTETTFRKHILEHTSSQGMPKQFCSS